MWALPGCRGLSWTYIHGMDTLVWENANIGDYTHIYTSENIISFLKYGSKSCRGVSTMKDDESFLFKCVHQKMKTYTRLPCGFLVDFSNKKWDPDGIRALESWQILGIHEGVSSKNRGTRKSSISTRLFHSFHHPFLGCFPIFEIHPNGIDPSGSWPQIFASQKSNRFQNCTVFSEELSVSIKKTPQTSKPATSNHHNIQQHHHPTSNIIEHHPTKITRLMINVCFLGPILRNAQVFSIFFGWPPKKRCVLGFAHWGTNLAFGRSSWSHTVPWAKFHGHEDDNRFFFGGFPYCWLVEEIPN